MLQPSAMLALSTLLVSAFTYPESGAAAHNATDRAGAAQTTSESGAGRLEQVLAARPADLTARDQYRHPRETLLFFGIEPGMKVAEVSPGSGWYTHIVAPLIGADSAIYGIYYNPTMWGQIYDRYTEEMIAERVAHIHEFLPMVEGIRGAEGITAAAYSFGGIDPGLNGTLDAVLMIRTLHNIACVETRGGYLTEALADVHALLKPGGVVGVVQHRAPEDTDDDWANGFWGYLKESAVVAAFEKAGFDLVAKSDVNANPKDRPAPPDYVWRLPPALLLQTDDEETRRAMRGIGESDRMTLKFVKR